MKITINGTNTVNLTANKSPLNLPDDILYSLTQYKISIAANNSAGNSNFASSTNGENV